MSLLSSPFTCLAHRIFSATAFRWVVRAVGGLLALVVLMGVSGCSPKLNWRDVQPGNSGLRLLLPCKPDQGEKIVPLGGRPTKMTMLGCDAGGATFAVALADLGDAPNLPEVLAQWQALTLSNMKATSETTQTRPLRVPGASSEPAPVLVVAQGQRPDGSAVNGWAAYFTKGSQAVQVVMYATAIEPVAAEIYFASLQFD
ncbi:MAG: hypothetical protein Q7U05_03245 [Polaromonas sp.]|nr:hypothetical protein [Polaromonas sp.]